jgi:hypothetical protein
MGEIVDFAKNNLHNNLHIVVGAFFVEIRDKMKELDECGFLERLNFDSHIDILYLRDLIENKKKGVRLKDCLYVLELQLGINYEEYFIEAQIHFLRSHFKITQQEILRKTL